MPVEIDLNLLPPHVQVASYRPQRIKRYQDNKLIEALPSPLDEQGIFEALELYPDFSEDQREWIGYERIQETLGLLNIMFPLTSHIYLATTLDARIREGLVGRKPHSRNHAAIFQDIYRFQREGIPFRQSHNTVATASSEALLAIPGMGKSTTIRRVLASYPQVIYHPDAHLFQVTYLHIEMPREGASFKSLGIQIISQLDQLIPDAGYYERYVSKGRFSGLNLLHIASRLMNEHYLGLLVVDEIQNITKSSGDDQVMMTDLVSLCNVSRIPQLYVGTNQASKVLTKDLRQARRSIGPGLGDWSPLPKWNRADVDGKLVNVAGEWHDFIDQLWRYQWTRKSVPLTEELYNTIFDCTQGVIDLALKLFIIAQVRAMLDGTETLSKELLLDVFRKDMHFVHEIVGALASGNPKKLSKFPDVEPFDLSDYVQRMVNRYLSSKKRNPAASARPGAPDFLARLEGAARLLGMNEADAEAAAKVVADQGTARNMYEAAAQLAKNATEPLRKAPSKSPKKADKLSAAVEGLDLSERPLDYRNALVDAAVAASAAATTGSKKMSVLDALVKRGMVRDIESLIPIE
ncbi:ATP-binding protein [Roseateles sp. So40a]|uniref:ATP-binding protein n=1 Tax=Roseateles sp. So40a TaxID=3400226 RepID=UPI003A8A4059